VGLLWGSFEVVITIIDVAYCILILNAQLTLKGSIKKSMIFLYGALIAVSILVFNYFTQNSVSSVFMAIGMFIIYSAIFIKGKWTFKLFWIGFPMILLFCIEILAVTILAIIQPETLTLDFSLPESQRIQLASLAKIFQLGLLYFLIRIKLRLEQFGPKLLVLLVVSPILSIFFMFSMYESLLDGRIADPMIPFQIALGLLTINLIILWMIKIIDKKNAEILEHKLQSQKQDLRIKNYEQLYATYEKFKTYQDRIDEIMTDLWGVLKYDNAFADRKTRMDNYDAILYKITHLRQNSNMIYCIDDEILNMVLSSRDDLAKKKNIIIEPVIEISVEHSYDSGVIGSILMIVLDNAIETVGSIEDIDGEKAIALSIEIENDTCKITVENPADKMIEYQNLMEYQGIALRVAHELAARYGGRLTTSCEDYYFTAEVNLPLPLEKLDK